MKSLIGKLNSVYDVTIDSYKVLREGKGVNTIVLVESNNHSYIAKIYKDEFTYEEGLAKQGELIQVFITAGIPFAERYQTVDGKYYTTIGIEGESYFVSLEDFLEGHEIDKLDIRKVEQIGSMLGKMHRSSEADPVIFEHGTSWSLFGGNATDNFGDYDENELCFKELYDKLFQFNYDQRDITLMKELYLEKREEAARIWHTLPYGAIQGDFCHYNMVVDGSGKISGIFDFNIAGNEVFINELCALGIYFAYFVNHDGSPKDIYETFIRAYVAERPLVSNEIDIMNTLFNIIRPFRFDRVDNMIELIEAGKRIEAEGALKETIALLDWDYQLNIDASS